MDDHVAKLFLLLQEQQQINHQQLRALTGSAAFCLSVMASKSPLYSKHCSQLLGYSISAALYQLAASLVTACSFCPSKPHSECVLLLHQKPLAVLCSKLCLRVRDRLNASGVLQTPVCGHGLCQDELHSSDGKVTGVLHV